MLVLKITFISISLLSLVGLFLISNKHKGLSIFFSAWSTLIAALAYGGMIEAQNLILVLFTGIVIVVVSYNKLKQRTLKFQYILAIHVLRIPVELLLHQLYTNGLIPKIMTFEGNNWDILSGISALLLLLYYRQGGYNKRVLFIWNCLSLCLLLNIVITAVLAAPTPIQQIAFEQPNRAVLLFPFILLPGLVVPVVLLSHLLLFRSLKMVNNQVK